jgi:hypothetical protein
VTLRRAAVSPRSCMLVGCVIAGIALLASCALGKPDTYVSAVAGELLSRARKAPEWSAIPDDVKIRFSTCFASALATRFTPEEIEQLDVAVLNDWQFDPTLQSKAHDRLKLLRDRTEKHDLSALGSVCPSDVAGFTNYSFDFAALRKR